MLSRANQVHFNTLKNRILSAKEGETYNCEVVDYDNGKIIARESLTLKIEDNRRIWISSYTGEQYFSVNMSSCIDTDGQEYTDERLLEWLEEEEFHFEKV